jgi:hypothetical protein
VCERESVCVRERERERERRECVCVRESETCCQKVTVVEHVQDGDFVKIVRAREFMFERESLEHVSSGFHIPTYVHVKRHSRPCYTPHVRTKRH